MLYCRSTKYEVRSMKNLSFKTVIVFPGSPYLNLNGRIYLYFPNFNLFVPHTSYFCFNLFELVLLILESNMEFNSLSQW